MYKNKIDFVRRYVEEIFKRLWVGMVDVRSRFVILRIWMWVFVFKNAINSRGGFLEDTKVFTCGSCVVFWYLGIFGVLVFWFYNVYWSLIWSWGIGDFYSSWWLVVLEIVVRFFEKRYREWNVRFRKEVFISLFYILLFLFYLGLFFFLNL